ncbi:MAG: hypothetical protein VB957_17890 [Pseudomonadales bacterium]
MSELLLSISFKSVAEIDLIAEFAQVHHRDSGMHPDLASKSRQR